MTNTISIELERSGFPVKLGEVELWFDSSYENIQRFFNIGDLAAEKVKQAQENMRNIHSPKDLTDSTVDVSAVSVAFTEGVDAKRENVAAQYDIMFGDGTFKALYDKFPDIRALENALTPLGKAIGERIVQIEEERTKEIDAKEDQYIQKKTAKKK